MEISTGEPAAEPVGGVPETGPVVLVNPAYYFSPPTVRDIPNYLPESTGPAVWLLRHYRLKERGVNVFLLSDGTYTQDTNTPENPNSGYPLPWITNDPSGPFSYVTNWDGTTTSTTLPVWIVKVYEGGHRHEITAEEAASLEAAGYTIEKM